MTWSPIYTEEDILKNDFVIRFNNQKYVFLGESMDRTKVQFPNNTPYDRNHSKYSFKPDKNNKIGWKLLRKSAELKMMYKYLSATTQMFKDKLEEMEPKKQLLMTPEARKIIGQQKYIRKRKPRIFKQPATKKYSQVSVKKQSQALVMYTEQNMSYEKVAGKLNLSRYQVRKIVENFELTGNFIEPIVTKHKRISNKLKVRIKTVLTQIWKLQGNLGRKFADTIMELKARITELRPYADGTIRKLLKKEHRLRVTKISRNSPMFSLAENVIHRMNNVYMVCQMLNSGNKISFHD